MPDTTRLSITGIPRLSAAEKTVCDEAIRTLERILGPKWPLYATPENQVQTEQQSRVRHESYVQLAIAVLEEIGKPTPITVLLERIRERRNDPTITRGSVETSLLRHLSMKGEKTEVIKPYPGTYALRQHFLCCS
jgi:hypothetical protein